jgi:hypothetical protein
MTLQEFNLLSLEQQQNALLRSGVYLGERKDPPLRMMLYQMDGFYVEVFFLSRYNKVGWFKGFDNTDELTPYLEKINVSGLLQEALP